MSYLNVNCVKIKIFAKDVTHLIPCLCKRQHTDNNNLVSPNWVELDDQRLLSQPPSTHLSVAGDRAKQCYLLRRGGVNLSMGHKLFVRFHSV